jgi:hypothetical protein
VQSRLVRVQRSSRTGWRSARDRACMIDTASLPRTLCLAVQPGKRALVRDAVSI